MRSIFGIAALAAMMAGTIAVPDAAFAHAKVVASTPGDGASVARPKSVSLTFSDAMPAQSVAASIVMTAMPGMADHPPMMIRNFQTAWSKDGRTMTLNLRQPLVAGTYDVRWQATGADGHRMTGKISFTVK